MSGYCKYCGSLIDEDNTIRTYKYDLRSHQLTWVGCVPCYKKHIGLIEK
jgi:hypothetical protein